MTQYDPQMLTHYTSPSIHTYKVAPYRIHHTGAKLILNSYQLNEGQGSSEDATDIKLAGTLEETPVRETVGFIGYW